MTQRLFYDLKIWPDLELGHFCKSSSLEGKRCIHYFPIEKYLSTTVPRNYIFLVVGEGGTISVPLVKTRHYLFFWTFYWMTIITAYSLTINLIYNRKKNKNQRKNKTAMLRTSNRIPLQPGLSHMTSNL